MPGGLALLLGVLLAAVAGLLNGLLVTRLNLPPFIVTLGTLSIFTAIALLYSGGESIQAAHLPALLNFLGEGFRIGAFRLTWGIVVVVLLYAVVGFVLSQTAWGRYVYAVGDDPESARLSGIPEHAHPARRLHRGRAIYGIAAWILIGRAGAATPNAIPTPTSRASRLSSSAAPACSAAAVGSSARSSARSSSALQLRAVPDGCRPAVARARDRHPCHRGRRRRPVDQEGEGMTT